MSTRILNPLWLCLLFVAAGFGVKLWLLAQPIDEHLRLFLADDAFYYFSAAQQAAQGHWFSADGMHSTNGFHVAYYILLVALASCGLEGLSFAFAAEILNAGLAAMNGLLLLRILRQTKAPAFPGLFFWLCNPFVFFISMMGVESNVQVTGMLLVIGSAARLIQEHPTIRAIATYTAAVAFAFYSRSDTLILSGISFIALMAMRRLPLRQLALSAAGIAALISPWFALSALLTGKPWQDSVVAIRLHSTTAPLDALQLYATRGATALCLYPELAAIPLLLLVLALYRSRDVRNNPLVWICLFGICGCIGAYGIYVRHFQYWYLTQPLILCALLFSLLAPGLRIPKPWGIPIWGGAALLYLCVCLAALQSFAAYGFYPWQAQYRSVILAASKNLEPGKRIGAFNSGVFSYFAPAHIPVINLDGVMNTSVIPYLKEKRLGEYLKDKQISYILDDYGTLGSYFTASERGSIPFRVLQRFPSVSTQLEILFVELKKDF